MVSKEVVNTIVGVLRIITFFSEVASLDEWKRVIEFGKDCLDAKTRDIEGQIPSNRMQNDALRQWIDDGRVLETEAETWLRHVGSWKCYLLGAKMRWDAFRMVSAFRDHDRLGDALLDRELAYARGPFHGDGYEIPVKPIVGRNPSETLERLKHMLGSNEFGRIAIHGGEGIGKTFLMKHLFNCALDRFANVFWVSSPIEFTTKCVQDAIAAVVKCVFDCDDDLRERAQKLSYTLAGLGRFVLFFDGKPEAADFSPDDIGIPVPAEGSECKLVVSTRLTSSALHSFETVEVVHLPREEAYELFTQHARIGEGYVFSLDDTPRLLVDTCCGVPRKIVNLGTCMSGKDDPCEWRHEYALLQPELEHRSKRRKKDMVLLPISMGGSGASSSAHRPGS